MEEKKAYTVYWVGGERDGETLARFEEEREAVRFAQKFSDEHAAEFDPVCGGVGIEDPDGEVVMDW